VRDRCCPAADQRSRRILPVHIGQHLLLGMTGPAFLALSAPVALRTLP
jgi:hypothetical protein